MAGCSVRVMHILVAMVVLGMAGVEAITVASVTFAGPGSVTLSGVLYKPDSYGSGSNFPAVVMLHGCSGMWSNRVVGATNSDGTPNLQNHLEKWGIKLAQQGVVALAVDSFSPRKPAAADSAEWQNQCSGEKYAGQVEPYTTRVQDARAGRTYLLGISGSKINSARLGLLGWSHGAQAVMVEAAVTTPTSTTPRATSDHVFLATTAFYPGCGADLGFGPVASSYWRNFREMQLHVGTSDSFFANCQTRRNIAVASPYFSLVTFPTYDSAPHSFDAFSQTWPSSKCASPFTGEECAMRAADIDALAFFLAKLT